MKITNQRRYVIIGSGVAGISAAQTIRANDAHSEISMISDDPAGYYSRPGLAYYLSGELKEEMLFLLKKRDIAMLHLKWHAQPAVMCHPYEHLVELANRAMLPYDRLLIATGAVATPLTVPGAQAKGVYKLDNLSDARAILKHCRKVRTAVVIGGGITALELVEGLRARNLQVHYFLRGDQYWNNVLDETESSIVLSRLERAGVRIHYQTEIDEILTHKDRVVGVATKAGQQVKCELVACAIGVVPRLELSKKAGIKVDRGILVDEFLNTSHADIFAAGDVAQVFDPYTRRSDLDSLWGTARLQGRVAGLNMVGKTTCYQKSIPYNVTRLAGLITTIIGTVGNGRDSSLAGITHGDSETWRQLPESIVVQSTVEENRLRLLVRDDILLGAVVMGDQTLSIPLQQLINHHASIKPIRRVLKDTIHLADIVNAFWKKWSLEYAGKNP